MANKSIHRRLGAARHPLQHGNAARPLDGLHWADPTAWLGKPDGICDRPGGQRGIPAGAGHGRAQSVPAAGNSIGRGSGQLGPDEIVRAWTGNSTATLWIMNRDGSGRQLFVQHGRSPGRASSRSRRL
jgi:hypothetical protein